MTQQSKAAPQTGKKEPRPLPEWLQPLGAQVHRLRLERGLSQPRLAELAGLSYKHIGNIESSQAEPGAGVLVQLARAFKVSMGEIFHPIIPMDSTAYQVSPIDLEALSTALKEATAILDRVAARQPPPLPLRAPRSGKR